MATAKRVTVQKAIPAVREIVLTLTIVEAETLRLMCCHTGGNSVSSRRQDSDAINAALADTGIAWVDESVDGDLTFNFRPLTKS